MIRDLLLFGLGFGSGLVACGGLLWLYERREVDDDPAETATHPWTFVWEERNAQIFGIHSSADQGEKPGGGNLTPPPHLRVIHGGK